MVPRSETLRPEGLQDAQIDDRLSIPGRRSLGIHTLQRPGGQNVNR